MKTILRNFSYVLRRFRLATFLNVAGLAVAFAAFLVIMMQIDYEWNFDRCHPTAERIYRVERNRGEKDVFGSVVPRAFADAVFASSPHIVEYTMLSLPMAPQIYFTVGEGGERRGFRERFALCYPNLVRLFGMEIVEGDPDCLTAPEKVLIPRSLARRIFGNKPAVGQAIHAVDAVGAKDNPHEFTVGGVYRDFPPNTQLNNVIYTAYNDRGKNDWYSQNSLAYLLLDDASSLPSVLENFERTFSYSSHGYEKETRLDLVPLTSLYYLPDQMSDFVKTGNPSTIRLLLLIGLLVIIVAAINFTNFSTSLAPLRIKSINTQKVLGSSSGFLRAGLVVEAVGISLVAYGVALLLIWLLNTGQVLSFVEADTRLGGHPYLVAGLGGIALLTGLLAGLYPAWYITSFPPALVLKGSFGLSLSGRRLRTALIGFQYVVSIGLIVGAFFVQLQNRHMRHYNLGYDKDQIAIVELTSDIYKKSKDVYVQQLKAYPGIEDVAFATNLVGGSDTYSMYEMKYEDQVYYTYVLPVSWNFLRVMGIGVTGGRDFTESDEHKRDSLVTYIYNRPVQEKLNMEPGRYIKGNGAAGYIAGFVGDVKMMSLRQREGTTYDVAFVINRWPLPVSYIRLKAGVDVEAAVKHIREVVSGLDPSYPFDVKFYDTVFDRLYHKEQYLKKMITLFSLLAIILSVVGVFGLVVFETQYRRKEIGIRKVHGATVREILIMFNKIYLRIVLICFLVGAPIAYFAVRKWLENFSSRTPIYWWTFAVALGVVALITLATVTFQNWRAANENPVNSIKSE